MSKDQYSKLIKIVDEIAKIPSGPPEDADSFQKGELETIPDYPFGPYGYELSTIISSKIFQDGRLKGRQLTGHAKAYKSYQIIELEKFVWLLCDKIHFYLPVDENERIFYELANLLDAIENSRSTIKHLFGKREEVKMASLSKQVKTWLNTIKESLKETSLQFGITDRFLTDQIIDLFKEHIPNAPEETTYNGVCNFLKLFRVKCNPKTLAMREYRRKRT